jgi:hypothetical protein
MDQNNIVRRLLAWFAANARPLPWRLTRDPYAIWVSEVMTSDIYTQYGSVVRLQGKSLAFFGYHSSSLETMAVVLLWCGVTTPNAGKKRPNARPDPVWPSTSSIGLGGLATQSARPPFFGTNRLAFWITYRRQRARTQSRRTPVLRC